MLWISKRAALEIHRMQIMEHGGAGEMRDEALLESALARPQNLPAYENADPYRLAAAYAFAIIKNHPFVDGNKRVGLVVSATFLALNGNELTAPEAEAASVIGGVASGEVDEAALEEWFRGRGARQER